MIHNRPIARPLKNPESFHANFKPLAALSTLLILLFCTSLINGCATHVEVTGTFPKPLSKRYPLSTTLVFNESFRNYRFENLSPKEVSVAVGTAQVALFSTVVDSMFENTHISNLIATGGTDTDLILVPSVADVQIAMPHETQLKIFEVWIKYKLELFNQQGELIADWTMPAYGKTPTRFLKSDDDALNQAAIVALRDAGANLITGFAKIPEVGIWLASHDENRTE